MSEGVTDLESDRTSTPLSSEADDFDLQWIGNRTGGSERRQVVVLAVAFAALPSGDLDEMVSYLAQRRDQIASISSRFRGTTQRNDPDLQLLCWGWPSTHEADPRFAVAAAIEIATEFGDIVRCGLDAGIVISPEVGKASLVQGIVGDALKGAVVQAALCECSEVVVSPTVATLIEGFFEIERRQCKSGVQRLVAARKVALEDPRPRYPKEVIGRTLEMAQLLDVWHEAAADHGACVAIEADAGLGKTTLVAWMVQKVGETGGQSLVISELPETRTEQSTLKRQLIDGLFLCTKPLRPGGPPACSNANVDEVAELLARASRSKPLLVAIENITWLDRPCLAFIADLSQRVRNISSVLLMVTLRPGMSVAPFQPTLHLILEGLPDYDIDHLIRSAAASFPISDNSVDLIREMAEGNPFHAMELARLSVQPNAVEAHRRLLAGPNRLNAGLTGKLDALASLKPVAQAAAVLGRTIDPGTLAAVLEIDERLLNDRLQMLVETGILVRLVGQPPLLFRFKHALIWHQAYGSMVKPRRRELHLKIAHELIRRADFELSIRPQHVAHNFKKAARPRDAFVWWRRAAYEAAARGADAEAIDFVTEALAAKRQEPAACTIVEEAELMGLLARQEQTLRGRGTPEAVKAYEAALTLLSSAGGATNDVDLDISWGIASVHLVRGDVKTALSASGQLIGNARERGRRDIEVMALRINGVACLRSGRVEDAIVVLTSAYEIARAAQPSHRPNASVSDSVAATLVHLASAESLAGRAGAARLTRARALDRAAYVEDPYTSCSTLGILALSALNLDEGGIAASLARASEHIASRHGYRYWAARAALLQAVAIAQQSPESELEKACAALDRYRATESGRACVLTHCLVAEVAIAARQPRLALELLSPYRNKGYLQGDWIYIPELKRLEALALSHLSKQHRKDALRQINEAENLASEHGSLTLLRRIGSTRDAIISRNPLSQPRKSSRNPENE